MDPNDNDVPGTGSSCLLTTGYELGFSKNENDVITGCIRHPEIARTTCRVLWLLSVAYPAYCIPLCPRDPSSNVLQYIYIFSSLPTVQYEKRGETIVHTTNYGY